MISHPLFPPEVMQTMPALPMSPPWSSWQGWQHSLATWYCDPTIPDFILFFRKSSLVEGGHNSCRQGKCRENCGSVAIANRPALTSTTRATQRITSKWKQHKLQDQKKTTTTQNGIYFLKKRYFVTSGELKLHTLRWETKCFLEPASQFLCLCSEGEGNVKSRL